MKIITASPTDDLQSILNNLSEPTHLFLKKGVYHQKITLPPLCVKLSGEDETNTVITNADYAKKVHKDGLEYNTFRTYTVCVTGDRCEMENITVENACPSPEINGQCVALSVNAKCFYAKNVRLKSTQDTLFCAPFPDDLVARYKGLAPDPASGTNYYEGFIPREQLYIEGGSVQIFENCEICGNVDFIFGGAEAYFINCKLISLYEKRGAGYVAAPSHCLAQQRGFTFIGCSFLAQGAKEGSVYLARPWRDFGKCDFINCKLDSHINCALFDKWNNTYRDNTARFAYYNLVGIKHNVVSWARELSAEEADLLIKSAGVLKK